MTRSQEIAIKKIRRLAEDTLYNDEYEFKMWEILDCGSFVDVRVETGRIGDEGTLAGIFCRERAQLFVGKRGGITYPARNSRGEYVNKRFKGYSLLQASIEQN